MVNLEFDNVRKETIKQTHVIKKSTFKKQTISLPKISVFVRNHGNDRYTIILLTVF